MALPPRRVGDAEGVDALFKGDAWLEDKSITLRLSLEGDCSGELDNSSLVADAAAAARIDDVKERIELVTDFFVGVTLLLDCGIFFSASPFFSLVSFTLVWPILSDLTLGLDGLDVEELLLFIPLLSYFLSPILILLFLAV